MKYFRPILIFIVLLSGCSKNSQEIPNPANKPKISAIPNKFTQRILVEEFTQSTCGQCPEAHLLLQSLEQANSGRVLDVAIHIGDLLQDTSSTNLTTGTEFLDSIFNLSRVYPSGLVNRNLLNPAEITTDNWTSKVNSQLGFNPACGIAVDAETLSVSNVLSLIVHVGFNRTLPGEYHLHCYMIENQFESNDSLYDQLNDFSIQGSTPDSLSSLYTLNDTIHPYNHKNVLRRIITEDKINGDQIPQELMTSGNQYIHTYYVNMNGINSSNVHFIIFVDKYATSELGHQIENVQSVTSGVTVDWQ